MTPKDFEWRGADSRAKLEPLCSDPASLRLRRLAPPLVKLARALHRVEEQPGEVSSFLYIMY